MRVEPVAGSLEGDAGGLRKFESFLETSSSAFVEYFNRVSIDSQVCPHSRLQYGVRLAVQGFFWVQGW